jgi:hypothetical protein
MEKIQIRWLFNMFQTLRFIYSFLIILMAGRLIFEIPAIKLREEEPGIKIPLYFMSGSIILSLYMFLLFLLRVKYSIFSISALFVIYFAYYCFNNLKYLRGEINNAVSYSKKLFLESKDRGNMIFMSVLLLLISMLITVFIQNLITPIYIGDVYCMWFFKAKVIFTAKTIPLDLFTNVNYWYTSFTYPLLTSLNIAWITICLGRWTDTLPKTFYSLQFLAMNVFFYCSLRRIINSKMAIIGTFITFAIPHVIGDITTGYVDLIVAFFGCFAAILMFNWMNAPDKRRYFYLSALFIGGAVWTHNEGLILLASMILTLSIYFILGYIDGKVKFTEVFYSILDFLLIFALVTLPFKLLISYFKLNQLWVSSIWQLFNFMPNLYRIPTIIGYFYYEFFLDTYLWLYFWIFFLILFLANLKRFFYKNLKFLSLFVLFSLAMIFEVFFISNTGVSFDGWETLIKQNLDRTLLIILFTAGFAMFASLFKQEN